MPVPLVPPCQLCRFPTVARQYYYSVRPSACLVWRGGSYNELTGRRFGSPLRFKKLSCRAVLAREIHPVMKLTVERRYPVFDRRMVNDPPACHRGFLHTFQPWPATCATILNAIKLCREVKRDVFSKCRSGGESKVLLPTIGEICPCLLGRADGQRAIRAVSACNTRASIRPSVFCGVHAFSC
jgi:hypothetical protein